MTLEDTKAYLRLESVEEDALVGGLLDTATGVAEAFIGSALVRRDFTETLLPGEGWQRLRHAPVTAITAVTDGAAATLPAGSCAIDIDAQGDGWVRTGAQAVRVTYTAGLAAAADGVPAPIAQGVIRLAAHLYEHRDDAAVPPAAVAALWRPFRRLRLAGGARA